MILASGPIHALAWAAAAAYALSGLGRAAWGARAQVVALVMHGLWMAATFVGEADAGLGIRWGFAPVLSLTAWLVLAAHLTAMPLCALERLTFLFVEAGFVVLTLAIVIGLFTMAHWRWGDHKTVLSLASW